MPYFFPFFFPFNFYPNFKLTTMKKHGKTLQTPPSLTSKEFFGAKWASNTSQNKKNWVEFFDFFSLVQNFPISLTGVWAFLQERRTSHHTQVKPRPYNRTARPYQSTVVDSIIKTPLKRIQHSQKREMIQRYYLILEQIWILLQCFCDQCIDCIVQHAHSNFFLSV